MQAAQLGVVIAEDSVLVRDGIARLIAKSGETVVAKAGDGDAFVAAVLEHRPDVSVVDVRMPPQAGNRTQTGWLAGSRRSLEPVDMVNESRPPERLMDVTGHDCSATAARQTEPAHANGETTEMTEPPSAVTD